MLNPSIPNHEVPAYAGNILIDALGPIPSLLEITEHLQTMPPPPEDLVGLPPHVLLHNVMSVSDLYVPRPQATSIATTTDLMLRQGYRYRCPRDSRTWSALYGDAPARLPPTAPAMAATVVGISGSGKTLTIEKCLSWYHQVVPHANFPQMARGLQQLTWLRADVPGSGRAEDLALNLMTAYDEALGTSRFAHYRGRARRNGLGMLEEWRQVASGHFLGLLFLDEIQNLFKIPTLEIRRSRRAKGEGIQLSVIEDSALKFILGLTNTWRIPLLVAGTPDGVAALSARLSTAERLLTQGFHVIPNIRSADEPYYSEFLFPALLKYQWVRIRPEDTEGLRRLVIELTAGVPRIIRMLWIFAHRCAIESNSDVMKLEHFRKAANTYLAPLKPAVEALLTKDPEKLGRYEDLLPRSDAFWTTLGGSLL